MRRATRTRRSASTSTATNATWIGGLPHTWPDQVDARNGGRYDKWLIAKPKRDLPFTLGHYSRADIPFYYALADAFTVCDQAFCSSLTGTTPNRLYLWTGTIRRDANDVARVMNERHGLRHAKRTGRTFPERLEDAGVSWRIYQNEISIDSGLERRRRRLARQLRRQPDRVVHAVQHPVREESARVSPDVHRRSADADSRSKERALQAPTCTPKRGRSCRQELADLRAARRGRRDRAHEVHRRGVERALGASEGAAPKGVHDERRRSRLPVAHEAHVSATAATAREISVPAGDVLHQFRHDVSSGALPAVSWLVAPENFSDHPSSAWYGAWYVSEVLDILTKNPEVWKKTVFILCYDENDGYFDHVPPFVAPHPSRPETGQASAGLDTTSEWANVHGRESSHRTRLSRAARDRVAMEPRRRGELTGVRSHVGDSVPRDVAGRQRASR